MNRRATLPMNPIIGVDFDNTIVAYDRVIADEVVKRGFRPCVENWSKQKYRDYIRRLPNGEVEWQKVQACVYGPRIAEACLIEGVHEFLGQCHVTGVSVRIVSHKTELANYDETGTNLREAAVGWMERAGLFNSDIGLTRRDIIFATTRREKIQHIRRLGCTTFVDDLMEVFLEPAFPTEVERILFTQHGSRDHDLNGIRLRGRWSDIYGYFFGTQG